MVNGYGIPPVVYEPFTIFTAAEIPAAGRELTAAMPESNWYLAGIWEMHGVVGGAGASLAFRKITDNSAPNASASSTVVALHSPALDLTAPVRVWRSIPLIANANARTFRPFNRLAVMSAGTLGSFADAVIIVKWIRVS